MSDRHAYELRLRGRLGPAAQQAFVGMDIEVEPAVTVLAGVLGQSELHAVLDHVQSLALELVEITSEPAQRG